MTYFEGEKFPLDGKWRPATVQEIDRVINTNGNPAFVIEGILKESFKGAGDELTVWCYRTEGSIEMVVDGADTVDLIDFMDGVVDCYPEPEGDRIIYRVPGSELFFLYYLPA